MSGIPKPTKLDWVLIAVNAVLAGSVVGVWVSNGLI